MPRCLQVMSVPMELLHVLGRRETSETGDLSGAIGLDARTALLNELSELDRQRTKLGKMRVMRSLTMPAPS